MTKKPKYSIKTSLFTMVSTCCLLLFFTLTIEARAGWVDNLIREGAEVIKPKPNTGNSQSNQGVNYSRSCWSVFRTNALGQSLCQLGGSLFENLSQQDQEELASSTEETIATGQESGWSNPDTGVEGQVKVTGTKVNTQTSQVVVQDSVETVPPLDLIAGEFSAYSSTNIFAGPGNNYRSVGYLTQGQIVQVIAKVQNQGWYLISQDGIGSGYVSSNSLKPTGRINTKKKGSSPSSQSQKKSKRVNVETKQTCKTVEQKVKMNDGTTQKNSVEACPEPDGTWDIA